MAAVGAARTCPWGRKGGGHWHGLALATTRGEWWLALNHAPSSRGRTWGANPPWWHSLLVDEPECMLVGRPRRGVRR
jgi:hypothetical protein